MHKKYFSGFDYLRGIFSIFVVIWHAKSIPYILSLPPFIQDITKIFYYNICLLAVPAFFQASLFIFYHKQAVDRNYFCKKRLPDLAAIYLIWMSIGLVVNCIFSRGEELYKLGNLENLIMFFVAGSRPELYFLSSLIPITFLAYLNHKFLVDRPNSLYLQSVLLCLSLGGIVWLDLMMLFTHKHLFSAAWNPICFIPYVFGSSILTILNRNSHSNLSTYFYKQRFLVTAILLAIYIWLSSLEWQLLDRPNIINGGELLPMYARISLIFGSFIICYWAIISEGKANNLIREISQESLSIYVTHRYILDFLDYIAVPLSMIINPVIEILLAIIIPMSIGKFLKRYYLGRVMLNASYPNK